MHFTKLQAVGAMEQRRVFGCNEVVRTSRLRPQPCTAEIAAYNLLDISTTRRSGLGIKRQTRSAVPHSFVMKKSSRFLRAHLS